MALSAGTRLGSYEILEPLGAGGMGEVYRAHDTKLRRDVAIKILPTEVAQDPARLGRFQREAHVLASLNHPNIAAIHGLEEATGQPFLVLELVEGAGLEKRLEEGAISIAEAVEIAHQIAEALEEAHERGIVHRDLKPANVKLTVEGRVKVLDFGLAKAWAGDPTSSSASDLSQSPTLAHSGTQAGVILGTAAYMSPEQARGKPVDRRTDIWAFGVVLFEMLTGRRLFQGETVSDVLASVMKDEPDWGHLPPATPLTTRKLLRRCLERDPKKRLQHMGDARLELDDAMNDSRAEAGPGVKKGPSRPLAGVALAVAALAGVLVGGALDRRWGTPMTEKAGAPARFTFSLPAGSPLALAKGIPGGLDMRLFDISLDGTQIVYVGDVGTTTQLFLATVGGFGAVPLAGTEGGAHPFFSPDGEWVGYVHGLELKKLSLAGGRPETVAQASEGLIWGADWGEDALYYVTGTGGVLKRVPVGSEDPVEVDRTGLDGYSTLWPIAALPGGRGILATAAGRSPISSDYGDFLVWSARTREWRAVLEGAGHDAHYAPPGLLVYTRAGGLQAVPFDLEHLRVTGEPRPILDDVLVNTLLGHSQFAVAESGTLVYARGGDAGVGVPTWIDPRGEIDPIEIPPQLYGSFSLSPDGRQLAIQVGGPTDHVHIYDVKTGIGRRLTTEGNNGWPIWAPDGERLAFSSDRSGSWSLYVQRADGRGDPVEVVSDESHVLPYSWSPDGAVIAYGYDDGVRAGLVSVESGREASSGPLAGFPGEFGHRFSPDGRWIAYSTFREGSTAVWVRPFPELEPTYKVSADGGVEPLWSARGDQLLFRDLNQWIVSDVATEPSFSSSPPRRLFQTTFTDIYDGTSWDLGPDGRFLVIKPMPDDADPTELRVVLNWFTEIELLVPEDE